MVDDIEFEIDFSSFLKYKKMQKNIINFIFSFLFYSINLNSIFLIFLLKMLLITLNLIII